ncbi:MAG: extensin family protein, partial [Novosphingobium sp.]
MWLRHGIQPAAERLLGSPVASVEHFGTNNCRRIGGGSDGNWSEHATGNAIDVSAFVLEDGRRISVLKDWTSGDEKATFLREVRDAA